MLEKLVRTKLLDTFPELEREDIRTTIGQERGSDLKLSKVAQRRIPYVFECKNRAAFIGFAWMGQANLHKMSMEERGEGSYEPVVVVKQNRSEPLVLITLDHFLKLIST